MKILVSNIQKMQEALDAVQKRCTARTVDIGDILYYLDNIKVPKSRLDGTTVHYHGGEHFPNAYQYTPYSTHWMCENHKGKWYLTNVYRDVCPNKKNSGSISYSQSAKEWLIDQASRL